jgi:predicted RNase H-like HicB family nuclease
LPGCVAAGSSVAEVEALMREAIAFHLDVMREYGDEIPPPTTVATAIAEIVTSK